jgi:hypothetical protein
VTAYGLTFGGLLFLVAMVVAAALSLAGVLAARAFDRRRAVPQLALEPSR